MTTPGFVEAWPHPFHPADDEDAPTVEVFQLRPDLVAEFLAWSGGSLQLVNAGPAVLLPDGRGVCGLGDFGVRSVAGVDAEPAAGFYTRWAPVLDEAP